MGCKPIALSLRWFESNPAHWLARRASQYFFVAFAARRDTRLADAQDSGELAPLAAPCLGNATLAATGAARRVRRELTGVGAASHRERSEPLSKPATKKKNTTPPYPHNILCIRTTSSQRLNLRPTSRSRPTGWKPQAVCRAIEAAWSPTMRPTTEWKP
jgi:hypothetical protein